MAQSKSFGRDPGLQFRMLLTLFLLGLVYAVLVGVLFAAGAGAVVIAVVAGVLFLIQFFTSDKIALYSMGAHEVSPQEAPQFHALIERLCVQANLPKPRVAIAQTAMPNAFAIGRSPKTATVCATTGLLQLLSPSELEGVMAHELQHILRRHTTRAVIQDMGTGLLLMALTGDVTGPLAYGLETARALGELRYSRRNEEEADVEGMKMLLAARVDPAGLITFFEKMQKEEGAQPKALTYLSSHPMPAERIARLKAIAEAWRGAPEPLLPTADWPALIKRC